MGLSVMNMVGCENLKSIIQDVSLGRLLELRILNYAIILHTAVNVDIIWLQKTCISPPGDTDRHEAPYSRMLQPTWQEESRGIKD
jgi:hypothetical protein